MTAGILLVFIAGGCDISEPDSAVFTGLEPVDEFHLQVPEPSGLALNTDASRLYMVSDPPNNRVYKTRIDGGLIDILSYTGDDLEGICYDDSDHTLWVVEEELREIVHLDTTGAELGRFAVDFPGLANNGFEGITRLSDGHFIILNQMNPGAILILDADLTLTSELEPEWLLDYSGICTLGESGGFIVLSDMSRQFIVLSPEMEILERYNIEDENMEGIDYDPENGRLYLVNDGFSKLYVYELELD